jgi:hypothetical protein
VNPAKSIVLFTMPFKIVQTVENKKTVLTVVPSKWERNGVLFWPREKNEVKLIHNAESLPKPDWHKLKCIKKREYSTIHEAERELEIMEQVPDTDAENVNHTSRSNQRSRVLHNTRVLQPIDLNDNIDNIIMYQVSFLLIQLTLVLVFNLGITMDQTLSWSPHIAEVSQRIFRSLHSLRRLQNFLPLRTKLTLTQSLLLPLLDYGDIAFLDLNEELLDKLERLQNVCIRYVFGLRKYDHISEFRSKLRWLPIRRRRDVHILSLLFNTLFSPTSPPYLSERFSYMADDSGHRLRSSTNLTLAVPSRKTRTYSRSFTARAVTLWNELPLSLRQSQSVASLKMNLKKLWLSNDL